MITDLLTPQWLKDRYLVGIDLRIDNGDPYPDDHYLSAIDAAIAFCEARYDIVLRQNRNAVYTERKDSSWFDSNTWYLTITNRRPLISLQRFTVQFGAFPAAQIPVSWAHVMSKSAGQVQIIPGPEGFRFPFISGSTPILGFDALTGRGYVPGWIRIEYTAGFETILTGKASGTEDGTTITVTGGSSNEVQNTLRVGGHVKIGGSVFRISGISDDDQTFEVNPGLPAAVSGARIIFLDYDPVLLDAIGIQAALPILDTAGDLIIGAGISNVSLSMDGISQSIGTTSGVENSGYGARAIQMLKRMEAIDKTIRRKYRAVKMLAV